MSGNQAGPSAETIQTLQQIVLRSVLLREPLPGTDQSVWFPDLAFITQSPAILIADDHVAGDLAVPEIDKPLRSLSEEAIRDAASREGDLAFLRFRPTEPLDSQIRVTVEVCLAPGDPQIPPLVLGGLQATFAQQPDGTWLATDPPTLFAV